MAAHAAEIASIRKAHEEELAEHRCDNAKPTLVLDVLLAQIQALMVHKAITTLALPAYQEEVIDMLVEAYDDSEHDFQVYSPPKQRRSSSTSLQLALIRHHTPPQNQHGPSQRKEEKEVYLTAVKLLREPVRTGWRRRTN